MKFWQFLIGADIAPHVIPVSAFGPFNLGIYYAHHRHEVWNNNGNVTKYCLTPAFEDPAGSYSLGHDYTILDHVQYFAADYATCIFVKG